MNSNEYAPLSYSKQLKLLFPDAEYWFVNSSYWTGYEGGETLWRCDGEITLCPFEPDIDWQGTHLRYEDGFIDSLSEYEAFKLKEKAMIEALEHYPAITIQMCLDLLKKNKIDIYTIMLSDSFVLVSTDKDFTVVYEGMSLVNALCDLIIEETQ